MRVETGKETTICIRGQERHHDPAKCPGCLEVGAGMDVMPTVRASIVAEQRQPLSNSLRSAKSAALTSLKPGKGARYASTSRREGVTIVNCYWCGAEGANRSFKLTTVCEDCFHRVMSARRKSPSCYDSIWERRNPCARCGKLGVEDTFIKPLCDDCWKSSLQAGSKKPAASTPRLDFSEEGDI